MRVLMLVQLVDDGEWLRGFTTGWIRAVAARVEHLDVITLERGTATLPDQVQVYSLGKERGHGRIREWWTLQRTLARLVPRADAILSHMIPRYAWLAAPWARLYHKPLFLWYTHRQVTLELRLATRLVTRVLTAAPSSFPLKTDKLGVMGHGIDPALFIPGIERDPPEILMVARLARIKRHDWLLRAASHMMRRADCRPFRLRLVGGPVEGEPDRRAVLEALVRASDPMPEVIFMGGLDRAQTAEAVRGCAIAVNLSPPGLFDKAALEAMFAAKPTLVSSPDFLPLLGDAADLLYVPHDADDAALAERLAQLLALAPAERAALGRQLRERALAAHSLDGLMDRLVAVMREEAAHA